MIDKRYGPGMPRTDASPYVGSRLVRFLAGAALALGVIAAVAGTAHWVNGLTHVRAEVTVPVELAAPDAGVTAEGTVRLPEPRLPAGGWVETSGPLTLRAWDSTLTEQLLARGDSLVLGLGLGAGGLLLRRLLLSVARGWPFEPGNARRLAMIAGLVAVVGTLAGVLPQVAGLLVLDRLDQVGPGSPFSAGVSFPLLPVLATPVVLALAEAFRRGAELADDADGLV